MRYGIILRAVLGLTLILAVSICKSEAGLLTVTKKVYLNIRINDLPAGQIIIGLFGQTVPKTVENFVQLASGNLSFGYAGVSFHRIIENFVVQGGDIQNGDGTGFKSFYGDIFPDENFNITHRVGYVNMANKGKDTNGSQFCFILTVADWLNGKHVVFGKVLEGMDVVHKMENLHTNGNDHPIPTPTIESCGVINVPVPFDIPQD